MAGSKTPGDVEEPPDPPLTNSESVRSSSTDAGAVTFRPVRPDDEPFLYELYCSTRTEDLPVSGLDPAARESLLKMQFMAQRDGYLVEYTWADHQIILLNDRPVGRVIVERTGKEHRGIDIALLPEFRNAGIGAGIIQGLLSEAGDAGKPFRIEVLKYNRAIRLYQRLGFVAVGDTGANLVMEWNS